MTKRDLHTFTARLAVEEYEALRSYAFFANTSINAVVVRAIRELLMREGTEKRVDRMVGEARAKFRRTVEGLGGLDS